MSDEPLRPDPDRLLQHTAAPHRGKLKVFFGACAGVGKTWAMLAEAQRLRAQGLDILIGVAETHGRKETAAMLQGLSSLPPRRLAHRGRYVYEFDLDAALARRPALILVDELAHSNAPGSRHPKRWQDVDELLEAGIDVFTTVNGGPCGPAGSGSVVGGEFGLGDVGGERGDGVSLRRFAGWPGASDGGESAG